MREALLAALTIVAVGCGGSGEERGAVAAGSSALRAAPPPARAPACSPAFADCDGAGDGRCRTHLLTDVSHCGACNNACPAPNGTAVCVAGRCGIARCDPGHVRRGDACVAEGGCSGDACPAPVESCAVANGAGVRTWDPAAAAYGPCIATACDAGYALRDGACVGESVLVVSADLPALASDVAAKLAATGSFPAAVDVFDAGLATPEVSRLRSYTAVLVYSNHGFADPRGLGDALAEYWDGGGRIVIATFANTWFGIPLALAGRFGTPANGYVLIDPQTQSDTAETDPLRFLEPGSPLLDGVSALRADAAYRSQGQPINGGMVVAAWGSGAPLVVRGVVAGRNRVDLNLFPPSSEACPECWAGDGAAILRNALLHR